MWNKKIVTLISIFTFASSVSWGQVVTPSTSQNSLGAETQLPPGLEGINVIEGNGRFYEPSLMGLRDYLNDIQFKNPKLYKTLNFELKKLESQEKLGETVYLSSLISGVIFVVGSFTFLQVHEDGKKSFNTTAFLGGIALTGAGSIVRDKLRPNENDIKNFVRKHNRINKEGRLKWQFGINLQDEGPSLSFTASF